MAVEDSLDLLINRPLLLDSVRKALQSSQFVLLSGKRGMGKTVLVKQFTEELFGSKSLPVLFLDLTDVMVEVDLVRELARACTSHLDTGQVKVMKDFASAFTYLRPVVRYDGFSSNPTVEFSLDEDIRYDITIDQLFGYASRVVNPKLLVIEHIERIVEPALRDAFRDSIQKNMRCKVMLTTSDGQLSATMSANGTWPFDSQTQQVRVDPIEEQQFANDLQEVMSRHRKKLESAAAERLIEWSRGEMGSALLVIERLCDLPQKQVDEWALEKVIQLVLQERAPFFRAYRDLLTRNQWLLLRGIARERGAVKVMGAGFVRKYGLGTPSSVQTALAALQEKDLVYEEEGRWWLYDVLLSRWLESA